MTPRLPEPTDPQSSIEERFLEYLDFYRSTIETKLAGLDDAELRRSRLPSGWTPLELLKHLVFMERRWLLWGFRAEPVAAPWGDAGPDGRWQVGQTETVGALLAQLREGGRRTRRIVADTHLDATAATGGRFGADTPLPTLGWILFHVLQEYARHAGHLDVVRELADGQVGE